jgi:hypothetical protein
MYNSNEEVIDVDFTICKCHQYLWWNCTYHIRRAIATAAPSPPPVIITITNTMIISTIMVLVAVVGFIFHQKKNRIMIRTTVITTNR